MSPPSRAGPSGSNVIRLLGDAGLEADVLAFLHRLATETGRAPLDIVAGLGLVDADRLNAALAARLGVGRLSPAMLDLLDAVAPRWEGPIAAALVAEGLEGARPGLVIGMTVEAAEAGRTAVLLARMPGLATRVHLLAPRAARRRLVVWDLGTVPLAALEDTVRRGFGTDGLARHPSVGPAAFHRLVAERYGLDFADLSRRAGSCRARRGSRRRWRRGARGPRRRSDRARGAALRAAAGRRRRRSPPPAVRQ
ncbi:hypothetical protein, partial [Methylobrevis pamukkalensis]|uniref:hypothetical protein n=1 Tax=Methylobrevis pamukkalensis TaxID=1439726 RepID=UPI001AED068B